MARFLVCVVALAGLLVLAGFAGLAAADYCYGGYCYDERGYYLDGYDGAWSTPLGSFYWRDEAWRLKPGEMARLTPVTSTCRSLACGRVGSGCGVWSGDCVNCRGWQRAYYAGCAQGCGNFFPSRQRVIVIEPQVAIINVQPAQPCALQPAALPSTTIPSPTSSSGLAGAWPLWKGGINEWYYQD